ncbi:MAG: PAS domain-containing sensor histidine kinase [Candidatus Lokiarchaeota archaeon]|nr:PAS domain-containing sensor histidine kinase [Candidatus Lokiarchaeota archaeon]
MNDTIFDLDISKTDYKSIFKKFPTPTYLWQKKDDDLILIDYNNATKEITDEKIINFLGIKASELYKEEPQILEELYSCINEQKRISRELIYQYQSTGQEKILFVIYDFVKPNLVLAHTKDITEQKKAEEKLRESEIHFRSIVDNSHDGILIVNNNYQFTYVNNVLCQILDYSYEEIVGQDFRNFLDEESRKLVAVRYIRRQRGEKVPPRYEFNVIRKDGEKRRVEIISTVNTELRGGITTIAQILDITERKKTEQKLKESEKKFRRIFEDSPFSVVLINLKGKIIDCNPATEKYSGYKKDELVGNNFRDLSLIHPKFLLPLQEAFNRFLKGEKIYNTDIQMYNKNGDLIWTNLQASRVKLNGETFFQVIIHNITKQKKADLVIKEQIRRLQELNQIQKEFITRASHELKTPLMSISGASELLIDIYNDKLDNNAMEMLEIIQRNKQRLEFLINNLLDIVLIDYKKLKLSKQSINISKIIREIANELKYFKKKSEINLILELPVSVMVNVDKIRFEQVITNLLLNAIKNSPPNSDIKIVVKHKGKSVKISISDTGIGLTEDEMKRIFTKFGKIERYGKGLEFLDIQGSGLGLYISKEIIELHDGHISVESAGRNMGAKFTIELPKE